MSEGFRCVVCGGFAPLPEAFDREHPTCPTCGSSVRFRSVIALLSLGLFGRVMPLTEFPSRPRLIGLGLSDWDGYAGPLAERLGYQNTYYHQPPYLDIANIPRRLYGCADFLISSDVMEHVPPPVDRGFAASAEVLAPGGLLVLTTPFSVVPEGDTVEHYPSLHDFTIVQRDDGEWEVRNVTVDGRREVFRDPVFHGGPGLSLEMRLFHRDAIIRGLVAAGFTDITVHDEDLPEWGVVHEHPWSLPITARAPQSLEDRPVESLTRRFRRRLRRGMPKLNEPPTYPAGTSTS